MAKATNTDRLYYSVAEVARLAGISKATIYRAVARGELEVRKLGGRTLIAAAQVRDLGKGPAA